MYKPNFIAAISVLHACSTCVLVQFFSKAFNHSIKLAIYLVKSLFKTGVIDFLTNGA